MFYTKKIKEKVKSTRKKLRNFLKKTNRSNSNIELTSGEKIHQQNEFANTIRKLGLEPRSLSAEEMKTIGEQQQQALENTQEILATTEQTAEETEIIVDKTEDTSNDTENKAAELDIKVEQTQNLTNQVSEECQKLENLQTILDDMTDQVFGEKGLWQKDFKKVIQDAVAHSCFMYLMTQEMRYTDNRIKFYNYLAAEYKTLFTGFDLGDRVKSVILNMWHYDKRHLFFNTCHIDIKRYCDPNKIEPKDAIKRDLAYIRQELGKRAETVFKDKMRFRLPNVLPLENGLNQQFN